MANALESQLPGVYPSGFQVKQHNNYYNYLHWKENDYYRRQALVYVPLSTISYKGRDSEDWDPDKFKKLVDPVTGIQAQGCNPVQLEQFRNDKWVLTDGNHRCAALHHLGYSVVPAIVGVDCPERPVSKRTAKFFDDKLLAQQILKDLKEKRKREKKKYIDEDEEVDATSLSLCLNLKTPDDETIVIVIPRPLFKTDSGPGRIKIRKVHTDKMVSRVIAHLILDVGEAVTSAILFNLLKRCAKDLGL